MVQALLNSIKTMMGSQSAQNKEFKTEAVRNNKNVSAALKDIYKMFSVSRQSDSKNSQSLENIEASSASTSSKVDRSNALLQESISLQSQMISELRNMSKTIASLVTNQNNTTLLNQNQQNGPMNILKTAAMGALAVGAVGTAGFAGATLNEYFMGSGGGAGGSGVGSSENAEKALEFFKSKGWMPQQAAGIVGNLQAESGQDLNPSSIGDGGKAYGIAQWHLDRQANFQAQFGKNIRQSSFEEQLAFIQWELENTERRAGQLLKNATTAAEAASIVDQYYERSSGEHRGRRVANATRLIEGDDSGTYSAGSAQPQNNVMGGSGGSVMENQSRLAGIRKLPLNSKLKGVLQQAAAAAGVDVEVYSGGQPRQGEGGARTGSTRHDHGNAADVYLYKEGRKLRDPEDREIMAKFVSAAASAGATGIGFGGVGKYMGESGLHIGFGKPATWGGSPWIASAAAGVFSNKDLQAENTDTSGSYASSNGGNIFGSLMGMGGGPLGAMTGLDNNIASLIAAFFGLPTLAGIGGSESGNVGASEVSSVFDESTEEEPKEMLGRSSGAGGVTINSPEFEQYKKTVEKKKPKEGDFFNYEYENLTSKIQTSAIEEKAKKVAVNSPKPYSQAPMAETRTDYGAVSGGSRGNYDTRASWAPRIAVLRPDDDVTKPLTWAARIKGYA